MPIQAPQWTDYLSCPICTHEFAENLRQPISLGCGHTICKTCLQMCRDRKLCPFDQVSFSFKKLCILHFRKYIELRIFSESVCELHLINVCFLDHYHQGFRQFTHKLRPTATRSCTTTTGTYQLQRRGCLSIFQRSKSQHWRSLLLQTSQTMHRRVGPIFEAESQQRYGGSFVEAHATETRHTGKLPAGRRRREIESAEGCKIFGRENCNWADTAAPKSTAAQHKFVGSCSSQRMPVPRSGHARGGAEIGSVGSRRRFTTFEKGWYKLCKFFNLILTFAIIFRCL